MTVTLEDIVLARGSQILVDGFSTVFAGTDRVGVFGPNGCGKTSLLGAILGDLPLESGRVIRSPQEQLIGYLPQLRDLPADWTVLRALRERTGVEAAERRLQESSARLSSDSSSGASVEYESALSEFISLGADSLDDRAAAVVADVGLGISLDRHCEGLSGGEVARVGLAGLLLSQYDVLLLDEPTNDLDENGLRILTQFLSDYRGLVILVSHDRHFLQTAIDVVVEFDPHLDRVTRFEGGYDAWQVERQRAHSAALEANRSYDETVAELKDEAAAIKRKSARGVRTAKRSYAQGSVDKLLRDRMIDGATAGAGSARAVNRQLDKLEKPDSVRKVWNLRLSFPTDQRSPASFTLSNAHLSRGGFSLGPLDLSVNPGERVRIHGTNGSGKSVLVEALAGAATLEHPRAAGASHATIGVLDQGRTQVPRAETTLSEWFPEASALSSADARTLLAKFGLGSDDVDRPMRTLSEGERTRVGLALIASRETTGLILDEPTNHLDLPAIEELEQALANYTGTLIVVSHDEAFAQALHIDRTVVLGANPSLGAS
ncbi:MAG: ATP-binding cassette domain-containing protein [Candidatus Nanopelagicales bacterium]